VELILEDYARVSDLLERYRDLNLGFVDAAVLAVVERLGERKLATLDHRHFATARPRHTDTLTLLPA
jgi:predicted nucleic acid-binding protein